MTQFFRKILYLSFYLISIHSFSQQGPDLNYNPEIINPAYPQGKGTVIHIDEGHYNFHTKNGRYSPFARLLERDGYVIKSYKGVFTKKKLEDINILVIANALNKVNENVWDLPNPSAFTVDEIDALENWVANGGGLFLIADHMPFPGAAEGLAADECCRLTKHEDNYHRQLCQSIH